MCRNRSLPAAVLVALVLAGCGAAKQTTPHVEEEDPGPPFDTALAAQIDAAVQDNLEGTGAMGASVAVMRADGSVHTSTAGIATFEGNRPVTRDDSFRIASITKTFMASIVLQLADEGVLSVDDTLDQWVPGFNLGPEVTLRRLMNHTSGVFNYTDDERFLFLSAMDWTPRQIVQWVLDNHGPLYAPGAGYTYSNTNFYLIGMTIEAATGKPIGQVLQERILTPLKLNGVWLEGRDKVPSSTGFLNKSPGPDFSISWAWTAGGMDAVPRRLCQWGRALYIDGKVLPPARLQEMMAETTLLDGRTVSYGLACDLNVRGGHQVVGHTGSTMGFRGEMFFDLTTNDCVVVQTNDFFADATAISNPVWKLLGPP